MDNNHFNYELDYSWDHPWPRSPIPLNEIERLKSLKNYNIMDTPVNDKYRKLCKLICKQIECPIAAISFIDEERQWFLASHGLTQKSIPRDVSFCAHTIMETSNILLIKDVTNDKRFMNNPLVTRAASIKFYAGKAIVDKNNLPIGTVFVFDTKIHLNKPDKIDLLNKVANAVIRNLDDKRKTIRLDSSSSSFSIQEKDITINNSISSVKDSQNLSNNSIKQSTTTASDNKNNNNSNALVVTAGTNVVTTTGDPRANVGEMLMNLLARTVETQQQLAVQQGVMSETLGSHSSQLDYITSKMKVLEAKMEQRLMEKKKLQQ